jgi:coenzyme F420-0:L-glutamate ligase / coenzyme F420-1:gamma-L-glutamate ligase
MPASPVTLYPLSGIPLVEPGDDLARILGDALAANAIAPRHSDILVVAQKVVSKAEGRYVTLADVTPGDRALALARTTGKDPRLVEVILSQSEEVVRCRDGLLVVAHKRGFVVANAAVDQSNIAHGRGDDRVLLLPDDPDASARDLMTALRQRFAANLCVIINDSFGRAWRNGIIGTAIGAAGVPALIDLVGQQDLFERPLQVSEHAFADEVASAASLLMGQAGEAIPAVLVRGLTWAAPEAPAAALIRPKDRDLFR